MKVKTFFRDTSVVLIALHAVNSFIDSNFIKKTNNKTNGTFYHWKHGDIFYKKSGQGEPLLLVHDLTVFSSNYEWSRIIDQLSGTYTVYALDLIGCGKSEKPDITYTNYFYVQLISDFVREVIGQKTKVAVSGLSASFVLMANAADGTLFDDLILINPKTISSLRSIPDKYSKIIINLFNLPVIGRSAYYIAVNKPNTEYFLTEKCVYNPFKLKPAIIKAYYDAAHTGNGAGKMLLASLDGHYINIDVSSALKNADKRIYLLTGEHSEKKEEINSVYTKINPDIQTKNISDSRYLSALESPEEIIDFLKTL